MLAEKIQKAETLVEALPYIKKFRNQTILIKYGGSVMTDPKLKTLIASDLLLLKYVGINPIVVHGGGKEISRWMKMVGKDAVFIDGLRFTDLETMEITEMVLSGKITNEIVSLINLAGGKAIGLSGKDANLMLAEKIRSKKDEDLGSVGEVCQTNIEILNTLCKEDYIPVVSSVGVSVSGESLNLNADHAAAELAKALKALKLIYLTDVQGVLIDNKLVPNLTAQQTKDLLKHPDVQGGMLPKLDYSLSAIDSGVSSVHIISGNIEHAILLELFTDTGIGTVISA